MHWGNQQWKQKPREEQAEADGTEHVAKVAKLLGTDLEPFVNGLCHKKFFTDPKKIFKIFEGDFVFVWNG